MKTDVCITVDTEFNIGGVFQDPTLGEPIAETNVWCDIDGRSHGLGFILETFDEHEIQATFFVEVFNTHYFGIERMGAIASRLAAAGHDVELHLHPCWRYFRHGDWRSRLASDPPRDSFVGMSEAESREWIEEGAAIFKRWDLPPAIAVRTGGLEVDRSFYRALAKTGITVSSNVGCAIFRPPEAELALHCGAREFDGVLEVPVLSYERFNGWFIKRMSCLTITGASWAEIEALLWQARRRGVGPVVLLTHAHEFVKSRGARMQGLRPNRMNQERLNRLCRFLRRYEGEFSVQTFRSGHAAWRRRADGPDVRLSMPALRAATGMAVNKLNEWF